ncbi:MAG: hypothetical protein NTV70_19170 [Acidobacteria bacterium]|nr:hypothetical protein [Acidobacteriota bacterium]
MNSNEPGFRGPKGPLLVMPFVFGIMAFTRVMGSPRFEQMHTPDVLLLTAAGANIGIGMVMVGMWLKAHYRRKP